MTLEGLATSTDQLARMLGLTIEQVWDNNTDASLKEQFSFDEVKRYIEENINKDI